MQNSTQNMKKIGKDSDDDISAAPNVNFFFHSHFSLFSRESFVRCARKKRINVHAYSDRMNSTPLTKSPLTQCSSFQKAQVGEFLLDQGFSDKDHLKIHGV